MDIRVKFCLFGGVLLLAVGLVITLAVIFPENFAMRYSDSGVLPYHISSLCAKDFSPVPVILISFDGFRPEYLKRGVTPVLNEIWTKGASAPYMAPSYPSLTFPNHYTMVTGLYPESHGIVSNVFYDQEINETYNAHKANANDGHWYGGEPIWITLKKNNLLSGTYYWPGSEAPITGEHPTYWYRYDPTVIYTERVDKVIEALDLPASIRPAWISLYFSTPDRPGHKYGPDSEEVTKAVAENDEALRYLLERLKERSLLSCVNIIIVSDHGMAATSQSKQIHLENKLPKDLLDKITLLYSRITFKNKGEEEAKKRLEESLTCEANKFQIFRREELPKRLHYSGNALNGDYVFLPEEGNTIRLNQNLTVKGTHGYDNHISSMNGIFIAYGPAFSEHLLTKPFQNIELYNLMCSLLNVQPAPNNGSWGALNVILRHPPSIPSLPQVQVDETHLIDKEIWQQNYNDSECPKNDTVLQVLLNLLSMKYDGMMAVQRIEAPWGFPYPEESRAKYSLLFHPDHITGYSSTMKIPLWTSFTIEHVYGLSISTPFHTPTSWFTDIRLLKEHSSCSRYGNGSQNEEMALSFLFPPEYSLNEVTKMFSSLISNGAPFSKQLKPHWNSLIFELIPLWGWMVERDMNVIIGPVFDRNADGVMDDDISLSHDEAIPTDYFAIVTRCNFNMRSLRDCPESYIDTQAFIYPQKLSFELCSLEEEKFALLFSAKIRDVERLTGLQFFNYLTPEQRLRLITKESYHLW